MRKIYVFVGLILSFCSLTRAADLTYCVPVKKINLIPFREIQDGKDLAYLMLMRSYISTDNNEPGLLKAYEFSPDGKVFTAKINSNLRWPDGSAVTPKELADGIARELPFRTLGHRVKLKSVTILDQKTFRIEFDSQIANLNGVIREALSTNSRHNRFWPVKKKGTSLEVLAKFPFSHGRFDVLGHKIKLVDSANCQSPDMSIFPETLDDLSRYSQTRGSSISAITFQPNTQTVELKTRALLIKWIRFAFANANRRYAIEPVSSFFLEGETGSDPKNQWSNSSSVDGLKPRRWRLGYEIPIFRTILEKAAKESGLTMEFIPLPTIRDLDGQILASGLQMGRHVILQDVLQWPHVQEMMKLAPKTRQSLTNIAQKSASTIPPDTATLRSFERFSLQEQSLAPIARRHPVAYTKKNSPVCLAWSEADELTFASKDQCREKSK